MAGASSLLEVGLDDGTERDSAKWSSVAVLLAGIRGQLLEEEAALSCKDLSTSRALFGEVGRCVGDGKGDVVTQVLASSPSLRTFLGRQTSITNSAPHSVRTYLHPFKATTKIPILSMYLEGQFSLEASQDQLTNIY